MNRSLALIFTAALIISGRPSWGQLTARPEATTSKILVERPVEGLLHSSASIAITSRAAKVDASAFGAGEACARTGKHVPPGLVEWRPDFAEACRASAKSGKPVLLFQMMGKLDDEFC